ncbi:MAG: hypothetical protein AAF739_17500 [Pseudomonadota bacterium]
MSHETILIESLGYLAGAFLIAMAGMKTQRAMRICNISANTLFILFGLLSGVIPLVVINSIILALHAYRLVAKPQNASQAAAKAA